MRGFHPAFPAGAAELLDLDGSLEQRSLAGGTASKTVRSALERAVDEIEEEAELLEQEAGE
jgi:argininosuccinate lyase